MGLTPHQLHQGIEGQEKEQRELTRPGEIQTASQRFAAVGQPSGRAEALADLIAACGEIVYESDCLIAVREAARGMSEADREGVRESLAEIVANNPGQAARIREVAGKEGLEIGDP